MNRVLIVGAVTLLSRTLQCGGEEPQVPNTTQAVRAPAATHGGQIVSFGTASYEVVMKASGEVHAYPSEGAPAVAELTARIPTVASGAVTVSLEAKPDGTFEGHSDVAAPRLGDVQLSATATTGGTTTATASAVPVVVEAARGGEIVSVGDARLEVAVGMDGTVQAYPILATTEGIAALPADAEVSVEVPVEGGATATAQLRWDAARGLFEGETPGEAAVVPGSLGVRVRARGAEGAARSRPVTPRPAHAMVARGPMLGGVAVRLDDGKTLELITGDDGRIVARPLALSVTSRVVEPEETVEVEVPVESGGVERVALTWQGPSAAFRGNLPEGKRVANGELGVLVRRGEGSPVARGRSARIVLVPAAALQGRLTALEAHQRASRVRSLVGVPEAEGPRGPVGPGGASQMGAAGRTGAGGRANRPAASMN